MASSTNVIEDIARVRNFVDDKVLRNDNSVFSYYVPSRIYKNKYPTKRTTQRWSQVSLLLVYKGVAIEATRLQILLLLKLRGVATKAITQFYIISLPRTPRQLLFLIVNIFINLNIVIQRLTLIIITTRILSQQTLYIL